MLDKVETYLIIDTRDLLQKWQSARLKLLETRSRNGLLQEVYGTGCQGKRS